MRITRRRIEILPGSLGQCVLDDECFQRLRVKNGKAERVD